MQGYESYFIQLRLRCEDCGSPMSFGALRAETVCLPCGGTRRTDLEFWHYFIEPRMLASMIGFPAGKIQEALFLVSNGNLHYGKDVPRCPEEGCQTPVSVRDLNDEALGQGQLQCGGCSKALGVRPADELVRSFLPGARWVIGESMSARVDRSDMAARALRCSGCGATLAPSPDASTLPCGYCGAVNILPGAGRGRATRFPGFYVLASMDASARRALFLGSDVGREMLAADHELDDGLARELASDPDRDVRSALAANPRVSSDVLEWLANTTDRSVRVGIAGNPNTPLHVLAELSESRDESVHRALARSPVISEEILAALSKIDSTAIAGDLLQRPALPEPAFVALASHRSDAVRERIAGDPRTGVTALRRLAWDDTSHVARIARARLAELGRSGTAGVGFWGSWLGRLLLRLF
jgi:predicted RNA-binding Zn-ribbon protein involved in translation (DUF1610 family)